MKNNKGFTLIELIATIIILGVIALIAIPAINTTIDSSRQKAYDEQVERIKSAAKNWAVENSTAFSEDSGVVEITVTELINKGYLEEDNIIDPKDGKSFDDKGYCVKVTYDEKSFEYEFTDDCD